MADNKNKKAGEAVLSDEVFILKRALDDLWNSIPVPFCSTNYVLSIVDVGESFKAKFSYGEDEIVGKNLNVIFYKKEDFEKIKEKIKKEREIKAYEALLETKGREKILFSIYAKPKKDGEEKISGYIFSFLDISEKKKAEEELQKKIKDLERSAFELKNSRAALLNILEDIEEARGSAEIEKDKTMAIVENFPEGLLFFNQTNRLSSVNPKIEEFFDLSQSDILGKTLDELADFKNLEPVMKILAEKGDKNLIKREFELKKGLVIEASRINVRKKEGLIGTLVILRNVSREKIVEKLKTEFVSISAHQLRTPLSAIKWTLRMILDGDVGSISLEQKDFLERTYESNERMIHLINDLLNVTRIEEGRFLYNVRSENMEKIIENAVKSSLDAAKAKGINLIFEKTGERIPEAEIDSEKISLVVQNLIDNAIHYTGSGGSVAVSIKFEKENGQIIVSVRDTGIGISFDQQTRVFSRFFRGANAVRAETEGTGLGLYIAKNIIEAHKGKIWFESVPDKGSTFYFSLPASL